MDSSAIYSLGLNRHPMVMEARRLLMEGWQLVVSLGPNHRRPYGNLYFACGQQRVTVNAEGWLKPGCHSTGHGVPRGAEEGGAASFQLDR